MCSLLFFLPSLFPSLFVKQKMQSCINGGGGVYLLNFNTVGFYDMQAQVFVELKKFTFIAMYFCSLYAGYVLFICFNFTLVIMIIFF